MDAHYASSIFHIETVRLSSIPVLFSVCGHHLSPRTAIVFSLLSNSLPNSSMPHTRLIPSSFLRMHLVPPCIFHTFLLCESYSIIVPRHGHILVATSSSRLLVYHFLLSGRSRSPTRNRSFSFFAQFIGPCRYVLIPISSFNPPYISVFLLFHIFVCVSLYLSSILSFTSVSNASFNPSAKAWVC